MYAFVQFNTFDLGNIHISDLFFKFFIIHMFLNVIINNNFYKYINILFKHLFIVVY